MIPMHAPCASSSHLFASHARPPPDRDGGGMREAIEVVELVDWARWDVSCANSFPFPLSIPVSLSIPAFPTAPSFTLPSLHSSSTSPLPSHHTASHTPSPTSPNPSPSIVSLGFPHQLTQLGAHQHGCLVTTPLSLGRFHGWLSGWGELDGCLSRRLQYSAYTGINCSATSHWRTGGVSSGHPKLVPLYAVRGGRELRRAVECD